MKNKENRNELILDISGRLLNNLGKELLNISLPHYSSQDQVNIYLSSCMSFFISSLDHIENSGLVDKKVIKDFVAKSIGLYLQNFNGQLN